MYNSFNEFKQALTLSVNFYVSELRERADSRLELAVILFILSIVAQLIVVIILVPVVTSVNR